MHVVSEFVPFVSMTQTAPRGGARSQKQGLKTQGFPASFGGSRTVAKRKVSALDLSAQLAFLSRNLICSFDFLVAEQFFSWMGTAICSNNLQPSQRINNFFASRVQVFLLALGWQPFCSWRIFFYSAGARDKWSQSPIEDKATQYSLHKEAYGDSYVSLRKSQLASQVQK